MEKFSLTSLNWPTDHTPDTGANTRREHNKRKRKLLRFGFVKVRDQTEGNTTPSGGETALYCMSVSLGTVFKARKANQCSSHYVTSPVWG
jgi:hypothetical protein